MPLSPSHEIMSYDTSFLVLYIPGPLELRERQGPPKEADTPLLGLGLMALLPGMPGMIRKGTSEATRQGSSLLFCCYFTKK